MKAITPAKCTTVHCDTKLEARKGSYGVRLKHVTQVSKLKMGGLVLPDYCSACNNAL